MTRNDPMSNDDIPFPEKDSWWSPKRPAPLQHREFSPPDDFTGIWHGVEYLRGGRVCPGPDFSEVLTEQLARLKRGGDDQ